MRSKNDVNVGLIAQKMGGGGHDKLAAFQTKPGEQLKNVKSKLIGICQEELKIENTSDNLDELFCEEE